MNTHEDAERSPPLGPVEEPSTPTRAAQMKEHFKQTGKMRHAVIHGDLLAFRAAALHLATAPRSWDTDPTWRDYLDVVRTAAVEARESRDVRAAAAALGRTADACAFCHKKLGRPKLEVGAPPADGSGLGPQLALHQWAAERMWDGLVTPSDEAWLKGSEVLGSAPLERPLNIPDATVADSVAKLAKETHQLAERARVAPVQERSKRYGELVAECSSCHMRVK